MKKLLIITQKVDEHDQLLGFFIEWIRRMAAGMDVSVLCLEKGSYHLPSTVKVSSMGKEHGNSKIHQLFNFYLYIISRRHDYDAIFVHMNPIWAVLGGWFWRLSGKKLIFWYTSGGVTLKLRIATWFANTILTASPESFRLKSKKVVVTGHGIDSNLFKPAEHRFASETFRILTVGRISPVKNYEVLIDAADILNKKGMNFSVTIVGEPALKNEKEYLDGLKRMIEEKGLSGRFSFIGRIEHKNLPGVYQNHDLFVHMSKTGSLDKTILEAMSCGMIVVSSNDASKSFLPHEYVFEPGRPDTLANVIVYAQQHPHDFRNYVSENHKLDSLTLKIIDAAQR